MITRLPAAGVQGGVWGSYQLRVRAVSWSGTGYDANGDCCDGVSGWLGLLCDTTCENKYASVAIPALHDPVLSPPLLQVLVLFATLWLLDQQYSLSTGQLF